MIISIGKYYCFNDNEYLYIDTYYKHLISITGPSIIVEINQEFEYYVRNRNFQISEQDLYKLKEISKEEFIEKTSEILGDVYIQLLKLGNS